MQQTFQSLLSKGVLATVQSFDGSANVLSLTLHTESGGGDLSAMILDELQAEAKSNPFPSSTQQAEQTNSSLSAASITVVPQYPQPNLMPETQKRLEDTDSSGQNMTAKPAPWIPQQMKNTSAVPANGWLSHHFTFNLWIQFWAFTLLSQQSQHFMFG